MLFRRPVLRRLGRGAGVAALTTIGLTACIGTGDGDETDAVSECAAGEDALTTAKQRLDETSGLRFTLGTNSDVSGLALVRADAVAIRPASFQGTFSATVADGEAIGIGEDVWIKADVLYTEWTEVDPAQFNLPAITTLLDPDTGLSSVLTDSTDVGEGEALRDENDQATTFCYYDSTITPEVLQRVLPSAGGESFDVEYAVDGDGALRKVSVTGDVYDTGKTVTYVLDLTEYDVEQDIQPPA